jgi:hypothetical protein
MRIDVRPTGRADVRCPRVCCPGVRCPRDRCDAGVRTDRRPVSAAAASGLSAPRWIPERVGAAGPARLGAPGFDGSPWSVSGLVVAARIGPGGEGMIVRRAVRGRYGWRRQAWAAASHAQRLGRRVRRLGNQGSWSSARCRSVGQGSTTRSRCARVAPPVRRGQVAGVLPDRGLDREVVTTLRGRRTGCGPVSSGSGGPIWFGGEQTAAAARPR